MALHIFEVLRRPLITEKSTILQDGHNKYAFEVDSRANKVQVKTAVEESFSVKVTEVNMLTVRGKRKRFGRRLVQRPSWKKALVSLQAGDKIQLFEGA
ncbi:MAG: 50S ribosomal protein L23 [Dehalococcoidia bacterium]|nr:50S ribosomal protein L23 [Dehalococcoidia bacterium]